MPVVNGSQLLDHSEFNARFNSFSFIESSDQYSYRDIQRCETGSVLVDNSLDPKLFLEESEFARIRDVVSCIATNNYPNSSQLSGRAVVKKGVVKKFYLDGLNTVLFKEADQIIFAKLLLITNEMSSRLSGISGNNQIHSYETILYPSTTLGRPLHLDRHDKSRDNQDCRSIKAFMNLSPNSFRIWGIGPTRPFLVDRLNHICDKQGLPRIDYASINSKKDSYPSWFDFKWDRTNLNHPVSIVNEYLNAQFLEKADIKGQFDIVYYDPFVMLVVDSKQVSHKPMYGELGVSVDMVYNKKDSLIP